MENTQQKTPEQWFQMLKEPYRSEAIKGINKEVQYFKEYPESLLDALYFSLHWGKPFETTCNDWDVIYNSIKAGETTYLEHETVTPEPIELRPEETDWKAKYNELKAKYEKLLTYNDELTERINETEIKNNQEKVYFYFSEQMDQFYHHKELESALSLSCNDMEIYEAVCIGKKKSVLVNE